MPCYTRVESTVEFGENTDINLLAKAMKSQGFTVTVIGKALSFAKFDGDAITGTYTGGTLTVKGTTIDEKALKRAYSTEVVKASAQRFGWTVKQTADNKFQVTRRV